MSIRIAELKKIVNDEFGFDVVATWVNDYGPAIVMAAIAEKYDISVDGLTPDDLIDAVDYNDFMEFKSSTFEPSVETVEDIIRDVGDDEDIKRFFKFNIHEIADNEDDAMYDNAKPVASPIQPAPVVTKTTQTKNQATTASQSKAVVNPAQPMPSVQAAQPQQKSTTPVSVQPVANQNTIATAPAANTSTAPVVSTAPLYANFVSDNWESSFVKWEDFYKALCDIAATETVYTHDEDMQAAGIGIDPIQKNLKVVSVMDAPLHVAQMAANMKADVEAVLSTMKSHGGTGLALKMDGGRIIPIGWSAIEGLSTRAGFTRNGFERHWKKSEEDAATELNGQFKNSSEGVSIIENCNKIRAMNSEKFAYGKLSDIAKVFEAFWKKTYPKATVQNMYISHTTTTWELNLSAYKDQILKGFNTLYQGGYYPVLQFASSNTASSAFRIIPALALSGHSGVTVPMCDSEKGLRVVHTGSGNYTERVNGLMHSIVESFKQSDTMMNNAAKNIDSLQNVQVKNAYNALLRAMANLDIAKKAGHEAAENFKSLYGKNPATAFDCFLAIANAYAFVVRDNPNNVALQFKTALKVGRAAGMDWQYLGNIPGDYQGY